MKITKLLLTCTAIAGISAAFAVAANAEIVTNNTYDKTAGTVSVATDLKGYAGDQMTVIVIPEKAYTSNSIADADILYIDQEAAKADAAIFQGMGVKGGKLDPGTYYIKVGGTNIAADGIIVEKIVVAADGKVYHYGDVNGDNDITINDALEIAKYYNYAESVFDDEAAWRITAADVNEDKDVTINDALEIAKYYNYSESVFDNHLNDAGELDWTFTM